MNDDLDAMGPIDYLVVAFPGNRMTGEGMPLLIDLRADPFERTPEESFGYPQWLAERMFFMVPAQVTVKKFVDTLKDFPPRQKSASWSLDAVLAAATQAGGAAK